MSSITQRNQNRIRRAQRTRAKIQGTATRPRLSVFRSNKYVYAQMIDDDKGQTLVSAFSKTGEKTAELLSNKAAKGNIKKAVFDKGHYKYHGHVKMLAETMRKGGVKI